MDFDTIATDFVAQHGAGSYECSFCAVECYVSSDPADLAVNRVEMKNLLLHARFDHGSPADIVRVQHTILLNTGTL